MLPRAQPVPPFFPDPSPRIITFVQAVEERGRKRAGERVYRPGLKVYTVVLVTSYRSPIVTDAATQRDCEIQLLCRLFKCFCSKVWSRRDVSVPLLHGAALLMSCQLTMLVRTPTVLCTSF